MANTYGTVSEICLYYTKHQWLTGSNENGQSIVLSNEDVKSLGSLVQAMASVITVLAENLDTSRIRLEVFDRSGDNTGMVAARTVANGISEQGSPLSIVSVFNGYTFKSKHGSAKSKSNLKILEEALFDEESRQGVSIHRNDVDGSFGTFDTNADCETLWMTYATDASRSHFRKDAAWAFVPDEKSYQVLRKGEKRQFVSGMVEVKDIHEAELLAIAKCVRFSKKHAPARNIRILTDSLSAKNIIEKDMDISRLSLRGQDRTDVHYAQEQYRLGKVEIVKVKGHSSNPLNNRADKVALCTRRFSQAHLSKSKVREYVQNALDNMTEEELNGISSDNVTED